MSKYGKSVRATEFSAIDFVELADRDYLIARLLTFSGKPMWRGAAYHSHQATEKYLKSLLVQSNASYLESHKLLDLMKLVGIHYPSLNNNEYEGFLNVFDQSEQVTRYGPFANYDPLSISEPGKYMTRDGFFWTDTNIKILDKVVFLTRGLVDFSSNKMMDNLDMILNGADTFFCEGWRLPGITIGDILTSKNDYFKRKM